MSGARTEARSSKAADRSPKGKGASKAGDGQGVVGQREAGQREVGQRESGQGGGPLDGPAGAMEAASAPAFAQLYPCHRCPLNGRPHFQNHDDDETRFVATFKRGELQVDPSSSFLIEGTRSPHLYTVLSGWGFRYKLLDDGRRQILNYVMPGDFLGLQSSLFGEMQHSVQSLSRMLLCVFERDALDRLFASHAKLSYDITWIAAREEQILEEHMLSIGRRSAQERAAYLLAYIHERGRRAGLIDQGGPIVPFTQTHLADTLGLSLVHTNKTLRHLQNERHIRWAGKSCYVNDLDALKRTAGWSGLPEVERPFI